MNAKMLSLPYMDNWKTVLLTAVINLVIALVFQFSESGITRQAVVVDSLICGTLNVIIDVTVIYFIIKRRRERGLMPANVPESIHMQQLPKNPVLLALVYIPVSALAIALINWLVMAIFGIESFSRWSWLAYKIIYSCLLSAKIIEYCIFRFVQPDCSGEEAAVSNVTIKNPLPKIPIIKEMFASLSSNISLNIIMGTVLGGAAVDERQIVLLYPTVKSGIWMTGLIFGLITGLLLTIGVLRTIKQIILITPLSHELPPPDRRLSWLPKSNFALTAIVCAAVMAISVVSLPLLMQFLGLTILNFYQFCIFITAYGFFIGRVFSKLLTARCVQSDYVAWVRDKAVSSK